MPTLVGGDFAATGPNGLLKKSRGNPRVLSKVNLDLRKRAIHGCNGSQRDRSFGRFQSRLELFDGAHQSLG
jgi:hypothetical protein